MAAKPVTPTQAVNLKHTVIPDFVIEVFNEQIIKELDGNYATLRQKDVVKAILDRMEADYQSSTYDDDNDRAGGRRKKNSDKLYKEKWLDVEPIYRKAGWKVSYDKPGFNESYEPTWKFDACKVSP